jgi:hypothetical protein
MFLLQDGIHAKFDTHRARFYWEGVGPKRKYHLVNWPAVYRPKACGGLGIINSKKMNIALMLKWVWKLFQQDNPIWAQILRTKYTSVDNIFAGSGQGGSQFWRSIHKIKHLFKLGAAYKVRDGQRTLFWLDTWHGDRALKDQFPRLFSCALNPGCSVSQVCGGSTQMGFRRTLDVEALLEWHQLREIIETTVLSEGQDMISWNLEQSGQYSVNSMYRKLSAGASIAHFKDVWAAKIPLKVRIFSWQLILDRLPSSHNIAARHGPGNGRCSLCGVEEDASHIFFTCSPAKFAWSVFRQLLGCSWCPANFFQLYAIVSSLSGSFRRVVWTLFLAQSWALWHFRNKLTIESKLMKHPANIIFKSMLFLQLWTPLAKTPDRPGLRTVATQLRLLHAAHAPNAQSGRTDEASQGAPPGGRASPPAI